MPCSGGWGMLPSGYLTELEAAPYRRRLGFGLLAFRQWLREHGPPGVRLARSHRRQLDVALSLFVDFLHRQKLSFDTAKHAVLAVQQLLHLKNRLPRAWGCMKAWRSELPTLPTSHRIPIPLELVKGLFARALDRWLSQLWPALLLPFCVLLRVGSYGLLRPGELFKLK